MSLLQDCHTKSIKYLLLFVVLSFHIPKKKLSMVEDPSLFSYFGEEFCGAGCGCHSSLSAPSCLVLELRLGVTVSLTLDALLDAYFLIISNTERSCFVWFLAATLPPPRLVSPERTLLPSWALLHNANSLSAGPSKASGIMQYSCAGFVARFHASLPENLSVHLIHHIKPAYNYGKRPSSKKRLLR